MMPQHPYRNLMPLLRVSACACMLWLPAAQAAQAASAADAAPVQANAATAATAATTNAADDGAATAADQQNQQNQQSQQDLATSAPSSECPAPADDNAAADSDSAKKPVQRGMASWYGGKLHGRKSASGERFNMHAMTAAHPSLPLHSWVLVRNVGNGKMAILKVNDRGPFHSKRILDVSYSAAKQLGFVGKGTARVEVRPLSRSEMPAVKAQIAHGIAPAAATGDCSSSEQ
jgi:rare lipoprotein A